MTGLIFSKRLHILTLYLNRYFLILIFLAIGSTNSIAIKFAFKAGWTPYMLGLFRMSFIGIFYFSIVLIKKNPIFGPDRLASLYSLTASVCKGVSVIFLYLSLYYIPASRAIILSAFSPIVNIIFVYLLLKEEKIKPNNISGIFISLLGIIILLTFREDSLLNISATQTILNIQIDKIALGDLFIILSVLFGQLMYIFEKKAVYFKATPHQLLNATSFITLLIFGVLFLISDETTKNIPLTKSGITSYIYLITVAGIFLFYYRRWLVSKLEITFINSFSHLGKGVAVFYAMIILDEKITVLSILAFAIIVTGTLVATKKQSRKTVNSLEESSRGI